MNTKPQKEMLTSEIITVTPDLANYWLENKNFDDNRRISEGVVKDYANTIKAGQWLIADGLKFDNEDFLIDGQHRLKAVCLANIAVDFLVIKGYERKSAQVLDSGKNRTLANVAQLKGEQWVQPIHTSIFNNLFHPLGKNLTFLKKFTSEEKIKAILTLKNSFRIALCYQRRQCGKNINSAHLLSVIVRAFYSRKSCDYTMKANISFQVEMLKDFLLLVYGYSYHSDKELFSQTLLNPSAAVRLRDAFRLNQFYDANSKASIANAKFLYCQTALFKYLSDINVKNLTLIKDNLFPVEWIDDLTFDKPE
jgi:hypothetical protein